MVRSLPLPREYGGRTVRFWQRPAPLHSGSFPAMKDAGPTGWYRRRSNNISVKSRRITSLPMYGFYFLELASYYSREGEGEPELLKLLYAALRAMIRQAAAEKTGTLRL